MRAAQLQVRWSSTSLKEALTAFQNERTVEHRNLVLKAFNARGDGYCAAKWVDSLPTELAQLDQQAFVYIIGALDAVGEKTVETWFRRMEEQSVQPTREIFEKVFRNMQDGYHNEKLLQKYKDAGFPNDLSIRTDAMSPTARFGSPAVVENMFNAIEQDGLTPSVATYNQVILSHAKGGRTKLAQMWFDRIVKAGLEPDIWSYTHLIYAAAKDGNAAETERRFRELELKGLKPDVMAYNRLLHVYQNLRDEQNATNAYERMIEAGVKPDIMTFNILMATTSMAKDGGVERAEQWFKKIQDDELIPTTATFHAILDGCAKQGQQGKYAEWWAKMDETTGKSIASYALAISCSAKAGDITAANKWFTAMHDMYPDACDVRAYTCVLEAISRSSKGSAEQMMEWWDKMVEAGEVPSRIAHNIVINYFCHKDDTAEAERCFGNMCQAGISPDIVNYNTMLEMYSRLGDVETCKKIWRLIAADVKLFATHATYLCMIRASVTSGDIEEASSWLKKALSVPRIRVDKRHFNAVLKGCADKGDASKVEGIVESMLDRKIAPDGFTVHMVFRVVDASKWDMADRIMSKIFMAANEKHYATIVSLCEDAQQWNRAQFWLEKAESLGQSRIASRRGRTGHRPGAESSLVTWYEVAGSSPKLFRHRQSKVETETPGHGWAEVKDEEGNAFYWNIENNATQWEYPSA